MGDYIRVEVNLLSKKPPEQILATLGEAGFNLDIEEIFSTGDISSVGCISSDFKYNQNNIRLLLLDIMSLEPLPEGQRPQLVFYYDVDQQLWGYEISGDTATPWKAVMQRDHSRKPASKADLEDPTWWEFATHCGRQGDCKVDKSIPVTVLSSSSDDLAMANKIIAELRAENNLLREDNMHLIEQINGDACRGEG